MRTIKGPGLFLAQFARDTPPHNTLAGIAKWAKGLDGRGIVLVPITAVALKPKQT